MSQDHQETIEGGDTRVEELGDEGVGLGATPENPTTFEPEEPEHPHDDK